MERDYLLFAGGKVNAIESPQGLHRELNTRRNLGRCAQVNLRNLVALHCTRVLDPDLNIEAAIGGFASLQSGVSKRCVAEAVAKGEGRGNRENGPRVEAIEALGRIGSPEALPTLQALARRRSIIGAARAKELRTAAESAIAALKANGGQR